jgi:hypothetical protein
MSKNAPDPPPAPNPYATAAAQTGSNVTTAIANTVMGNANVKGPLGSTTFNQIGEHEIREPVLDKDGNQVKTRKWIADPNAQPELQYRTWQPGSTGTTTIDDTGPQTISTPGQYIDSRTGQVWNDEGGGRWEEVAEETVRKIPKWEQVNTLSENQAKLLSQQENLGMGLNDLAKSQVERIGGVLNTPIDSKGLTPGAAELLKANGGMIERANFVSGNTPSANFMGGAIPTQQMQTDVELDRLMQQFGQTSRGLDYGDNVRYANVGGPARSTGNFGFEMERNRVEDAIRQRQQPELARQRASLENQLVNQGFMRGTEAFNAQMDEQIRRENDASTAAILAGGQEQTRMGQLALGRFGAENAAQAQADEQARARGLFGLGLSQFRNQTQGQEYSQLSDRARFQNEAITGNNTFSLAEMAAENEARGQQFGIDMTGQQLRDSRIGNQFQADMAGAQLGDSRTARQYDADMNRLSAQQSLRQQGLQEQLALRNQPINEISALMAGGQVSMPQFTGFRPSAMSETPVGDYVYKSADIEAQNYRAQQAAQAQSMGGLFGMGGSLLGGLAKAGVFGTSDRRVKTDIERIGTLPNSLGVYSYRFKGQTGREIGVMAQEVEKLIPWAVVEIDGIKHVNYAAAVV